MADHIQQIQSAIEDQNKELSSLQKAMQTLIDGRQRLIEQQNENDLVKREFDLLEQDAKIYKLIGSILVPQNLKESRDNVEKRLEFITREVKKVDDFVKENSNRQAQKRAQIAKFQEQLYKIVQAIQTQQQQQQK